MKKLEILIKVATKKLQEKDLDSETSHDQFMKSVLLDRLKNKKGSLTRNERTLAKYLELNSDTIEPTSLSKRFITSRLGAGLTSSIVLPGIGWVPGALTAHLTRQSYAGKHIRKINNKNEN